MHELSVCQALVGQLIEIGERESAERITSVRLRIGPLSGIVAELLAQAFPLAAAGTLAEDAELLTEAAPVRVRCTRCGAESEASPSRLLCGVCGDFRTVLASGDELLLASVELLRAPVTAAS
jgi:hydrogenase nickel incorporation protein HypA/HybF